MKVSLILLQRGWFEMLAHLESTKMIKFLPNGFLCFWGVSIMKAMSLLVLMKTMWQVHLRSSTNKV
jgi:hypothetical protein